MTQTYVWGNFLAGEPPVREKNGPSHSSPAPPNVFAKLTHVSLLAGYCLLAKTCSALKCSDGSFTLMQLIFRLEIAWVNFGGPLATSSQPCGKKLRDTRKTVGIKWPSPDLYRDKIVRKDISRGGGGRRRKKWLGREDSKGKKVNDLVQDRIKILLILSCIGKTNRIRPSFPSSPSPLKSPLPLPLMERLILRIPSLKEVSQWGSSIRPHTREI